MALSKAEFNDKVADLYRNLYDLVHLRTHSLADILISDPSIPRRNKGWQMHHLLLDAIEELNPGRDAPVFAREWRRYQIMMLRFVDGLTPEAVAEELSISRRQYFREQKATLETIADILWERHASEQPAAGDIPASVGEQASLKRMELLRLEAARVDQANRHARVGDVMQRVLPLLEQMTLQRGLEIQPVIPTNLPNVSVDQNLLRQMLLGMLGYLIESSEQAVIKLTGQAEESAVCISVSAEPRTAIRPNAQTGGEMLATLEVLTTLSGAHIMPVRVEGTIVGFDMRLPVAQRAVLVIDDNEDVLELFRRYLSSTQYRVVTAQTAREALELARRMRPYAITLDLMMPDEDGWDLLQTLLTQPDTRHIPVIVCTVLKQKALALSLGATAFLEKPISKRTLLSVLKALD